MLPMEAMLLVSAAVYPLHIQPLSPSVPEYFRDAIGKPPTLVWRCPGLGIVGDHTGARIAQITDGTAKTFAGGEKWVSSFYYEIASKLPEDKAGSDNPGDNGSMFQGFDQDTVRAVGGSFSNSGEPQGTLPKQDTEVGAGSSGKEGSSFPKHFGSAHSGGTNMVKCDGSVQNFGFDVDPLVWNSFGGRDDGDL